MRKLSLTSAAKSATSAKPVKAVKPVKAAAAAAPAPAATVPAAAAAAPAAIVPAKRRHNIVRTAATIAAMRANYNGATPRDEFYFAFFAPLAKAAPGGLVTLQAVIDSGGVPAHNGSADPIDAGAIIRLHKAGIIVCEADGTGFRFTERAKSHKLYASA